MDRKLVWTEKASSDIEAIIRYIARRDPKAAVRIVVAAAVSAADSCASLTGDGIARTKRT
jgi:plasmid stabilization system protein ParE